MRIFLSISILFFCLFTIAQNNTLIIHNDAYFVVNGGTSGTPVYAVVNQSHANGIVTSGTGGNIISEGEYNYVKWNISSSTGTYVVPFTTGVGAGEAKIPYSMQISSAGSAGGSVLFSTYETSDMNAPWPSTVTHMTDAATGTVDNSLFVIDRFWIIDAGSYGTKPACSMSFGYNTDASETGGTNTLTVGNLGAQRFNSGANKWESWFSGGSYQNVFGTDNGAGLVSGVSASAAGFYRSWTLTDKSSPLPIEMLSFTGKCDASQIVLKWSTASEANNDYFLVEKSFDGINYGIVANVDGAGNSSAVSEYTYVDYSGGKQITYYKITPIDFNGNESDHHVIAVEPCLNSSASIYSPEGKKEIIVNIESESNEIVEFYLYDVSGRIVKKGISLNVEKGMNTFSIDVRNVSFGIYNVFIKGNSVEKSTKVVLN